MEDVWWDVMWWYVVHRYFLRENSWAFASQILFPCMPHMQQCSTLGICIHIFLFKKPERYDYCIITLLYKNVHNKSINKSSSCLVVKRRRRRQEKKGRRKIYQVLQAIFPFSTLLLLSFLLWLNPISCSCGSEKKSKLLGKAKEHIFLFHDSSTTKQQASWMTLANLCTFSFKRKTWLYS